MADKEKKDKMDMDISRRDFLQLAGTGVLAGAAFNVKKWMRAVAQSIIFALFSLLATFREK